MLDQLRGDGIDEGPTAADEGEATAGDAGEVFLNQQSGPGERRWISAG